VLGLLLLLRHGPRLLLLCSPIPLLPRSAKLHLLVMLPLGERRARLILRLLLHNPIPLAAGAPSARLLKGRSLLLGAKRMLLGGSPPGARRTVLLSSQILLCNPLPEARSTLPHNLSLGARKAGLL
jgi:hypothetical protein